MKSAPIAGVPFVLSATAVSCNPKFSVSPARFAL